MRSVRFVDVLLQGRGQPAIEHPRDDPTRPSQRVERPPRKETLSPCRVLRGAPREGGSGAHRVLRVWASAALTQAPTPKAQEAAPAAQRASQAPPRPPFHPRPAVDQNQGGWLSNRFSG